MAEASKDRRTAPRQPVITEHMAQFIIPGSTVYQLKLQDISQTGAGVVVRSDSKLLTMIQVDQHLKVKLLSPRDAHSPQGDYQARIAHITESQEGRFKGHVVVGIELLQKVADY
jgi:hypothetical protein